MQPFNAVIPILDAPDRRSTVPYLQVQAFAIKQLPIVRLGRNPGPNFHVGKFPSPSMPGPLNRVPPSMYPYKPSDLSSEIEDVTRFAPASNQAEAERMRTCEDDPPEGDQRKTPARGRRWTSSEGILVEAAGIEPASASTLQTVLHT